MTASTLTASKQASIERAVRVLNVIRSCDPLMPMGVARSLLVIAASSGEVSLKELETAGISPGATHKHRMYLEAGEGREGTSKSGLGLIVSREDYADGKRYLLSLSQKGEELMERLSAAMDA